MPMKTLMQIQREITLAEDCSGKGPAEAWGLCETTSVNIEGKHCPSCDTTMPALADDPVGNCLSCGQTCTPLKAKWADLDESEKGLWIDAATKAMSGLMICSRTWSAWSYGTMTADDFRKADEDSEAVEGLACTMYEFTQEKGD